MIPFSINNSFNTSTASACVLIVKSLFSLTISPLTGCLKVTLGSSIPILSKLPSNNTIDSSLASSSGILINWNFKEELPALTTNIFSII